MSTEPLARSDGLRDSLDALSDRVDALSAMVLEPAGAASSPGRASALDRRLQELIGQGSEQTGAELAALGGEIDALRGFVADRPNRPAPIAAAAADPLRETIMELARRIDMLGDVIHSSSGRGAGDQSRTTDPADALAEQDARAEARFVEVMQRLDAGSRKGEQDLDSPSALLPEERGRLGEDAPTRIERAVHSMGEAREAWDAATEADPSLSARVSSFVVAVEALGSRIVLLSGIVNAMDGSAAGHEAEIAGIGTRIGDVIVVIEGVVSQWCSAVDATGATSHLASLELTVADAADATEQLGLELRAETMSLAAAVAQEHERVVEATKALEQRGAALETRMDSLATFASSAAALGSEEVEALAAAVARRHAEVLEVTAEWNARRVALESRMDDLTALAASTATGIADEMSRAMTTLSVRLERLELDRQAVASSATAAESSWAEEREALEIRLDEIAGSMTSEVTATPDVARLVDELAGRLARMEEQRGAVAHLAALAEAWSTELASLGASVDQGLATLGKSAVRSSDDESSVDARLSANVDELAQRIEQIEVDRDAVRAELATTAASWAAERAALQGRVSELAALVAVDPAHTDGPEAGEIEFERTPQELDRLRIGVEGLRMRLAYHEKIVSDLAGSKGVMQRLDELTARLDQLSAIVMAQQNGVLAPSGQSMPAVPFAETSGIISRLDEADRLRAQSREKMLEQMEKIATRMDWRLQRLEAAGVPVGAGVDES